MVSGYTHSLSLTNTHIGALFTLCFLQLSMQTAVTRYYSSNMFLLPISAYFVPRLLICFMISCLLNSDGVYMMEVDRVVRPGGYWILSGPPINWKTYYNTWKRSKDELEKEQKKIEELAELLCWEKKYEKGDIAIWRKKINANSCKRSKIKLCETNSDVWYVLIFDHYLILLIAYKQSASVLAPVIN